MKTKISNFQKFEGNQLNKTQQKTIWGGDSSTEPESTENRPGEPLPIKGSGSL
jgi:hypothetical protein